MFVGRTFRSDKSACSGMGLQALKLQWLKPLLSFCLKSELKLRPTNPAKDTTCSFFSPFDLRTAAASLDDDAEKFFLSGTE
jgi:hypothetical protein